MYAKNTYVCEILIQFYQSVLQSKCTFFAFRNVLFDNISVAFLCRYRTNYNLNVRLSVVIHLVMYPNNDRLVLVNRVSIKCCCLENFRIVK